MKTYQLKFLAWVFSAFLPPDDPNEDAANKEEKIDYYTLLDIPKNANADDIKKAYRKRSLQLHPDKLRQRGMVYQGEVITEDEARARFQQMKAAYDTLSDPKKRQIYDALGHKGMDFVINPSHAYDPHVLMSNLAKSSVFDRTKLMALVVMFFGVVLLQPILICAKVDQMLEENGGALENSSWVALLIPFWFFAVFYCVLLVIAKAVLPLLQWISFVIGILFLTLKFDNALSWAYAGVFVPFYFWMGLRLYEARSDMRSVQADMSKMVTIEYVEKYIINETKQDEDGNDIDVEQQLHRTYNDLNEEERDNINKEHIIVHVPPNTQAPLGVEEEDEEDEFDRIERSPEYQEAKIRYEIATKSVQRIIIPEIPLIILIIVQLDYNKSWNWGITFLPLWIALVFECCGGCYGFFCTSALAHIEVQEEMEAHIAKEMEAKQEEMEAHIAKEEANLKDKDKEPKANEGESSKKTDEGADNAKTADVTEDKKATTEETAAAKPEKLDTKVEDGIDTAVKVETPTKTEIAKSDSEADKANDDDDDFMFEMDEDTFHHFQQAEVEAENKATEAQSRAIASFCNIIFQTIIAAVFVAKLNQVYEERDEVPPIDGTTSFSTFWILFPFLLISGCIICCFSCAIFGASNIDTALSSDDDNEDGDNTGGEEEAADTNDNDASPVILTPPPPSSQGADEPPTQKSDTESNAKPESPNKADEGSGLAPTEAEDMDDLD